MVEYTLKLDSILTRDLPYWDDQNLPAKCLRILKQALDIVNIGLTTHQAK
jgi:hypothetical protein